MADSLLLTIGLYDDPEQQKQDHYAIDLYQNNFAIFGSPMSGKTTVIKTILIRIHQICAVTSREEVYILDFGNNLSKYTRLPYVVACFDATNEENVRRIFKKVQDRFLENIKELRGRSYLQCKAEDRPPHITFVIDGLNSFLGEDRYTSYHDSFQRLARDGLSKGLSIIIAANEPTGGVHKLLPSFKKTLALDLPKDVYPEIYGHRVEKPMVKKGRGVVSGKDGVYEFQAYLPYNITDPLASDDYIIDGIIDEYEKRYCKSTEAGGKVEESLAQMNQKTMVCCRNKKMKYFTDDLTKSNWHEYRSSTWEEFIKTQCKTTEVIAGLDYYTLNPVKIDLVRTRSIAIYGKKSSGKSNLLSLILEKASGIQDVRVVILEDGRKGVEDPDKAPMAAKILSEIKDVEYLHSNEEFEKYIREKGYYDIKNSMAGIDPWNATGGTQLDSPFVEQRNPFTVFVVQSRMFYQATSGGPSAQLIYRLDQFICNESDINPKLFVFSDVQKVVDDISVTIFNNWIDHAFLLDDIIRFINSSRGQKSVFSSQDIEELKENYGKCELGDGFYLNLELEELSKLKFIKQEG